MASYIIPDLGRSKLQEFTVDKADYFLKYFRYSSEVPQQDAEELPSYWIERKTKLEFSPDNDQIKITCDVPADDATNHLRTVGIYSNDRVLVFYLVLDFLVPKLTHQRVIITLNLQEFYHEITQDNAVIKPLSTIKVEFENALPVIDNLRNNDYPTIANKGLPSSLPVINEDNHIVNQYGADTLTVDNSELLDGWTKQQILDSVVVTIQPPLIQLDSNNYVTRYPTGEDLSIYSARKFDGHTYDDAIADAKAVTPPRVELNISHEIVEFQSQDNLIVYNTKNLQGKGFEEFNSLRKKTIDDTLDSKLQTDYNEDETSHIVFISGPSVVTSPLGSTVQLNFTTVSSINTRIQHTDYRSHYTYYIFTGTGCYRYTSNSHSITIPYTPIISNQEHSEYIYIIVEDELGNLSKIHRTQINFVENYTREVPSLYFVQLQSGDVKVVIDGISSGTVDLSLHYTNICNIQQQTPTEWIITTRQISGIYYLVIDVEYKNSQNTILEKFTKLVALAPMDIIDGISFTGESLNQYNEVKSPLNIALTADSVAYIENNDVYSVYKPGFTKITRSFISTSKDPSYNTGKSYLSTIFSDKDYHEFVSKPFYSSTCIVSDLKTGKQYSLPVNIIGQLDAEYLIGTDEVHAYILTNIKFSELTNIVGYQIPQTTTNRIYRNSDSMFSMTYGDKLRILDLNNGYVEYQYDFNPLRYTDSTIVGDSTGALVFSDIDGNAQVTTNVGVTLTGSKYEFVFDKVDERYYVVVFQDSVSSKLNIVIKEGTSFRRYSITPSIDQQYVEFTFNIDSRFIYIALKNTITNETHILKFKPHLLIQSGSITYAGSTFSITIAEENISFEQQTRIVSTVTSGSTITAETFSKPTELDSVISIQTDIEYVREQFVIDGIAVVVFEIESSGGISLLDYTQTGYILTVLPEA